MRRIANILREWDWWRVGAAAALVAAGVLAVLSGSLVAGVVVLVGLGIALVLLSML
jgi:hypothetical protein